MKYGAPFYKPQIKGLPRKCLREDCRPSVVDEEFGETPLRQVGCRTCSVNTGWVYAHIALDLWENILRLRTEKSRGKEADEAFEYALAAPRMRILSANEIAEGRPIDLDMAALISRQTLDDQIALASWKHLGEAVLGGLSRDEHVHELEPPVTYDANLVVVPGYMAAELIIRVRRVRTDPVDPAYKIQRKA